jgi:predicted amidohydrolase
MKTAAIQFCPIFKDKRNNLLRLAKLVAEAAKNGAKLVVLPELASVGYSFMSEDEARPFAESLRWLEDRDTINRESDLYVYSKLATQLDICIVAGFVELDSGTQKLYNAQIYFEPSGYYDSYRKINFFGNDHLWASKGTANPPVVKCQFEGKRVGLLICRDVRDKKNDKWSSFYEPGDADVVALSANWGDGGFPAISWMEFVENNKVTLIVSNRYGYECPNDFGEGGICIIEKTGKVHCEGLKWKEDCIVYADV